MAKKIEDLDGRFDNPTFRTAVREKLTMLGEDMTFEAFKKWDRTWSGQAWGIDWLSTEGELWVVNLIDDDGWVRGRVGIRPGEFDETQHRLVEKW